MTLSDISIRKPAFAWMLMLGLLVFGGISFSKMGISQLPDVDFPVLNVSAVWVGASPETMELAVTDVIENAIMTVEGIKSVQSKCQEGLSNTTIEFELNRDINVAFQDVQTKLSQALRALPRDMDPPVVTKSNPEDQPIIWAGLLGDVTLRKKIVFAKDYLRDRITTIEGVGDLRLGGYLDPNLRVWIQPQAMVSRQLVVDDIISAINSGNVLAPAGSMQTATTNTNLRVMSEATTEDDFKNIRIPARGGAPIWTSIKLSDVAHVEEGLADVTRIMRVDGEPSIGLGVIKQRGSNAVAVGESVIKRLNELKSILPQGLTLKPLLDTTKFIQDSTHELIFTLGLSALLTSIVCWLFLGSWSSAFNVILAIPVSLMGSFIFLKWLGFTINTFTLLSLSLSIGIVVDDAIMVLENIVRHFETGMGKVKASLIGAREITGAAVAASLAILAIFIPVVFMDGIIGKFFFQFGVTMSVTVMLSLLEALTLAPMRCSQFLQASHDSKIGRAMNRFMDGLSKRYHKVLTAALDHRIKVLGISVIVFVGSLLLGGKVKQEFVPAQDINRFMAFLYTPMGSSITYTSEAMKKAEEIVRARPEVSSVLANAGGFQGGLTNQGMLMVMLKDAKDRPIAPPFKSRPSQADLINWARGELKKIKGFERIAVIDPSLQSFGSGRGMPIQFQVLGPDWPKLADYTKQIQMKMEASGLMLDVDTDYNPNLPEIKVVPDRDAAAVRGVTISNIANTLSALFGSFVVGKYTNSSGHRDDIRLKLEEKAANDPTNIQKISVRNNRGEMVPFREVVSTEESKTLLTIGRYNRERSITLSANLVKGKSQVEALEFIEKTTKEILPDGFHIVYSGNTQTSKESSRSLLVALALGILVAYMVLASQFNSFIHPTTILLALPFSITGAILALWLLGVTLNIYSMIGILLLMGIVKKNSILLVEFTNHQREQGKGVHEALLEACPLRLRPILMTSVATIAAAVPAALAIGPGAETTRPMAVVVIGGVIVSTLLTLIVVPCAYSLFSRFENKKYHEELHQALHEIEEMEKS